MQLVKLLPSAPTVVLSGVLKGVYAAGTDYAPGEVVTYNGGTYIMHTDAAAGTAPTDTDYWQAINSPQAYVESIDALTLTNTTTDNTISVYQNGNVGTSVATDGAIHIENTGNTGIGLGVYTNIGATADAPLVSIHADNAAFDQSVVKIVSDAITQKALEITSINTEGAVVSIINNGVHLASSGRAVLVVKQDNASSTALNVTFQQDGSGGNVYIDSNGNGVALAVYHDDTLTNPTIDIVRNGNNGGYIFGLSIKVDNAGIGNKSCGIDFSGMSDTEPLFKFPSASPDVDLSTKSPETDAEAGWVAVMYGTTTYAMPVYSLS